MIPIPFLNNYWICGKLVKQEDFLPISHEVPWYLVPKSLPSLHSHCSIFHILFSSNTDFFVIHTQPLHTCCCHLQASVFSSLHAECLSLLPELTPSPHSHSSAPPHTPGPHCHSQIVLFLSVYVSVLPTRPWVLWVLGLCLTYLWIPTHPILGTGRAESDCWWLHQRRYPFFPPFYSTLSANGSPSAHWVYKNVLLLGNLSIQHSICEQREASQRGAKKAPTSQPFQEGMLYVNTRWTCVQIHNSFLNSISELSRFSSKLYLLLISLDIVCKAVLNY